MRRLKRALETAVLNFQDDRRTDEHMVRCDLVPFFRAGKVNVPTLGHRFSVKFPWVGKAIEVKCPTFAPPPPPRLNIDRCITVEERVSTSLFHLFSYIKIGLNNIIRQRIDRIDIDVRICVTLASHILSSFQGFWPQQLRGQYDVFHANYASHQFNS